MALELTKIQKDFILQKFFFNRDFAGWKGIATKLLEKGKCVVAGEKCIWVGGVGNFINTKKAEDSFGCIEYNFDLEYFLGSKFFKETTKDVVLDIAESKKLLEERYSDLNFLATF